MFCGRVDRRMLLKPPGNRASTVRYADDLKHAMVGEILPGLFVSALTSGAPSVTV